MINLSIKYLDCVGFFASLANKMMLRKAKPTKEQLLLWDRRMVPVSRKLDPVVLNTWGKSVLGIWKRQD
ncbi:MAG: hypothetical protein ACFB21_03010 [Opitutales bacterium]